MAATSSPVELFGLDPGPADEVLEWTARAREFARVAVRPIGQALDRMAPGEIAAPGSPLLALLDQAHREGFTRLGIPRQLGGLGLGRDAECLVIEELAAADAAIASLLLASPVPFAWAAAGPPRLAAELAGPYFSGRRTDWIGCWGPAGTAERLRARADGDTWVLSGATPPLPGAGLATHALLPCVAGERSAPAEALVPLHARGVSRRPAAGGAGLRALCPAGLALDGVRLPAGHLGLAGGAAWPAAPAGSAQAAGGIVALAVGRAAYEGAARWTREATWARRSPPGGAHLRSGLLRMLALLESARTPARAAYLAPAGDGAPFADQVRDAHARAAAAAAEVTAAVARLCAADATPLGVPFLDGTRFDPDKLLRDAQAAYPTQGEHHGLRQDP